MTGVLVTPTSGGMSPSAAPDQSVGHGGLAGGSAVSGIDQTDRPELVARTGIGVEGVQSVVLSRDENHIVFRAVHGQIGDPQRLRINGAVDGARGELAEAAGIHVGRRQRILPRVGAVPSKIVVVGVHAEQIRDCHDRDPRLRGVRRRWSRRWCACPPPFRPCIARRVNHAHGALPPATPSTVQVAAPPPGTVAVNCCVAPGERGNLGRHDDRAAGDVTVAVATLLVPPAPVQVTE